MFVRRMLNLEGLFGIISSKKHLLASFFAMLANVRCTMEIDRTTARKGGA